MALGGVECTAEALSIFQLFVQLRGKSIMRCSLERKGLIVENRFETVQGSTSILRFRDFGKLVKKIEVTPLILL